MAKQLNVNLAFTADTSQALQNLQALKQNLQQIASMDISNANISTELKIAASSAQALQTHLSNAFNTKTGNLDLSKLDASLKRSGASLSTLSNNLLGAGISGEKAFLQIQSSIASANTQLVKANGLVANFMTTLKNTARWQISSSILHGFMGAVQSAYGYAQDLNESLNNIRIVTGASTEEMSRFAAEANKTAKILSTSTTKYTNASLIYFQQGLNEEEVKQRTDITVKMANAAGASVEEVSNQLTAVWNNFAKSGEDLEHYADVMTALGAATASSTDEIAGGLEKFAAVADTIGLSFDYAASALATITSNTRQSEEVVGTALKTIFARIQGLNLGETLDDGTTLNKYSEALQRVGISIFEQNGEIKKMDSILDEMANKWKTLAEDEQIALAQTVAGVRQYTQLVSLMDNWDSGDSDSMMANLKTSANADGTLQQQSDIYSESWEAASERVRAALESIYKELVPDDMFIGLLKGLEKVLNMVEALVNAFGGLEGILMLVSSVVLTKFTANIGQGIQTGIDKVKNLSNIFKELGSYVKNTVSAAGQGIAGATQATFQNKQKNDNGTYKNTGGFEKLAQSAAQAQTSVRGVTAELERQQALSLNQASQTERTTKAFQSQVQTLKETTALTKTVKDNAKLFTEDTSKQLLNEIEQVRVLGEKKALLIEQSEILKEQNRNLMDDVAEDLYADAPEASGFKLTGDSTNNQLSDVLINNLQSLGKMSGLTNGIVIGIQKATNEMTLFNTKTKTVNTDFSNLEALITTSVSQVTEMSSITSQLRDINLNDTFGNAADKAAAMQAALDKTTGISDNLRQRLQSAINALKSGDVKQFQTLLNRSNAEAKNLAKALGVSEEAIKRATQAGQKQASNIKQQTNAQNEYNNALNQSNQNIQTALANAAKIGPVIAQGLSSFQGVAMGISSVSNAITTLTDSSASFTSKLTATAMGLTMGFRGFMIVIQGINTVLTALNSTQAISNALSAASFVLSGQITAAEAKETLALIAQEAVVHKLNESEVAEMLTAGLGLSSKKASAMARLIVAGAAKTEAGAVTGASAATAADTVVTNAGTAANIAYAASQWLAYWPMLLIVIAIAAIVAITVALINARKQEIETNKQVAETAQKNADAAKEEADANNELVKSYQSALKTFQETGENKEELLKISLEVADAYGIEGAAVDALAGNYANLTKKIIEKRKAELQKTKGEQKNAVIATNTAFGDALREGDGYLTGWGSYTGLFDNGWDNSDEQVAYKALQNGTYNYLSKENGEIRFNVDDISDPAAMYAYYTELEQWITEMQTLATNDDSINLGASEIYQDAVAELKEGREYYDQLKTYMLDMQDTNMELAAYSTTLSDGQGILDIDSLEEYKAFEEQYLKNYKEMLKADGIVENSDQWNELMDSAKEYLGIFENLSDVKVEQRAFDEITNENNKEEIKKLKEYYETLTPEEQDRFWTLGIDENSSLDSVKDYMDYAQEYLNANHLTASIKVQNDAVIAFKSGDFKTLKELYNGADSPYKGIASWEDFLKMSTDEMEDFLNSDLGLINKAIDATQAAIDKNKTDQGNKKIEMGTAETARNTAWTNWQTAAGIFNGYTKPVGSAYNYNPDALDVENRLDYSAFETTNPDAQKAGVKYTQESTLLGLIDMVQQNANTDALNLLPILETLLTQTQNGELLDADDIAPLANAMAPTLAQLHGTNEQNVKTAIESNFLGYSDATDNHFMSFISNVFEAFTATSEYKDYVDQYNTAESNAEDTEAIYNEAQDTYENKKAAYETSAIDDSENLLIQSHQLDLAHRESVEAEGIDYEEFKAYRELFTQSLEEQNPELEKLYENVTDYQQAINDIALANKKLEKGAKSLTSNWDNWNKVMTDTNSSAEDISAILPDVNDALQDVLNLDTADFSLLPPDFAQKNWSLINDVVNGVEGAVDELRNKAGEEILLNVGVGVDSNLDGQLDTVFADLHNKIAQYDNSKFTVGVEIDPAQNAAFFTACNEIVNKAGMTAAQAEAYFSSMGYDAEVEEITVPPDVHPWAVENPILDEAATELAGVPIFSGTETIEGENLNGGGTALAVKTITPNGSYGGGVGVNTTAPKGGGGSGGGGGGGGSSKKAEPTKKTDVVDRYKEIEDKLDDQQRLMNKTSKSADRLWGSARIKAMRDVNKQLETNIELLKKKRKEAQDNLKIDKEALKTAIQENLDSGLTEAEFNSYFDEKGNFTEYDEILTKLYEEKKAAETAAGDEWDEDEQKGIDEIQERIDKVKEAIEQYDETKELIQDMDEEIMDAIYEWQDNNYEILNLELELKVEINDANMEMIEYYMSKIEDDVYASAEAFGYMNQQMGIYNSNLQAQDEYAKKLEEDYYAGKISLDAYKEGLRNVQSTTIENLQSLEEVKQSMREYYGEVLDMALEEIAIYTDEMENLNSVLDHYSNIMELIGKQDDTVTKGKILNSKANNLRNELNVQKKLYEESNAEAEKWAKLMSTAIEGSNEYETYKANWQAAQQAANDAQDAMLSKTEEWAEAMKAIIENELAGFGQELEKALTGGTSFDELLTSMERRSSLQEEYLTHTNKIYETNKLMRTAQQEIDKTTNSIAKKRLQSFIGETNELQNQKELSQYELEIQQAKYDLLLAEIAAEEARNAKSTVRLQRDSEGNMSYVYTADTDAVSAAQQELEDKQNALYNLGLEGANDYSQKYAETLQEAQDAITELTQMWMSGEISSEEEFNRRRAEIQEYYGEKLKQYSGLHQVALTTDSRVIADAWSTDFSNMIGKTNEWNSAVDSYFENAAKSMEVWSEVCATVLEDSGLNDLNGSLNEIDQKSQDLQTTLIGEDGEGGVVAAMMAEAKAAGELSKSYINVQNEIDRLIGKYEELLEKVNADYTNPDTPEVDPAIDPEETPEEETPTETPTEEPEETGPTYQTGTLTWTGNGASRVWKDSSGKTYAYGSAEQKAIQKAFDRAYSANYSSTVGHGYRGDYWLGGGKLDADVLHEKYGLATGGYTGDWEGSYGKLAFLHQKELVLNANDTKNFLESMNVLERILQIIDLQALNSALGGGISVPTTGHSKSDILEQQVSIEAHFPNVTNHNEIEEAFNNLINTASQYANRKN